MRLKTILAVIGWILREDDDLEDSQLEFSIIDPLAIVQEEFNYYDKQILSIITYNSVYNKQKANT